MEDPGKKDQPKKNDFYENFIQKLQQGKSANLRNSFINFIKDIQNDRKNVLDLITDVNNFREGLENEFQEIWMEDEDREELNGEAIEGLVIKNLYDKLASVYPLQRDKRLEKLFVVYDFIEPKHLEIPDGIILESTLQHAADQIRKIEKYRTPRDKVISIINACKIVSTMVAHAQKNLNKLTGADDFLPTLIYTVLKAKPANVACDISFIRDLRSSRRLRGMEEYYFTAFESAIHFLENLTVSQLKIEKEEFEQKLAESEEKYKKEHTESEEKPPQELKKEDSDSLEASSQKDEGDIYRDENLKAIAEDIAESIHNNYKDVIKKVQDMKEYSGFDPKAKKFYNKNPKELTIGEIDTLMAEYNNMCNLHREISRKLEELNTLVEEKINPTKKQEKSLLGIFKFK